MFNSEITPEKMVVARRSFPIGKGTFQGRAVKLRGGNKLGIIYREDWREFDVEFEWIWYNQVIELPRGSWSFIKFLLHFEEGTQGTTGLLDFTKLQEIYHLGKNRLFFSRGSMHEKNRSQLMLDLFINSILTLKFDLQNRTCPNDPQNGWICG